VTFFLPFSLPPNWQSDAKDTHRPSRHSPAKPAWLTITTPPARQPMPDNKGFADNAYFTAAKDRKPSAIPLFFAPLGKNRGYSYARLGATAGSLAPHPAWQDKLGMPY